MSVLLDTDVIIDILRGRPEAQTFYRSLRRVPTCSEITRAEVLQGMRSPERDPTLRLLSTLQWHPVDRDISELAGGLGRAYRRSHQLGIADLCIAATAQLLDLPLATGNIKHYPMFSELRPIY